MSSNDSRKEEDDEEEEEEEEAGAFWWRKGVIQAPRAVVKWDHVDESRPSRGIPEKGRKVTWSELFLDLIIVTDIGLLGEAYQQGAITLLELVVIYRVIYCCWWSTTQFSGRFYTDDLIYKYATGAEMLCLVCAALRIGESFNGEDTARCAAHAAGWYHLIMVVTELRVVYAVPHARKHVLGFTLWVSVVESAGNFLAVHFVTGRTRLIVTLILIAAVDPIWHAIGYSFFRLPKKDRVPIHVDHMIERRGCLRLILFGEVVTGVTVAPRLPLSVYTLLPVFLGFLLVLNLKLLAFDVDVTPLRRHCYRAGGYLKPMVFLEAAFFFDVSMAILGSCVKLVLLVALVGRRPLSERDRVDQAHVMLAASVAIGVVALTLERLMHDQTHLFGRDHWFFSPWCFRKAKASSSSSTTSTALTTTVSPLNTSSYAALSRVEDNDDECDDDDEHYEDDAHVVVPRRIFLFQLALHALAVAVCVGLAAYCSHVDKPYELELVLAALAGLTSLLVFVNLLDEVLVVTTDSVRRPTSSAHAPPPPTPAKTLAERLVGTRTLSRRAF